MGWVLMGAGVPLDGSNAALEFLIGVGFIAGVFAALVGRLLR